MSLKNISFLVGAILVSGTVLAQTVDTETRRDNMSITPAPLSTQPAANEGRSPAIMRSHETNPAAPVKGKNSFTEDQAKERLSKAGYNHVSPLKLDNDGVWRGTATKNGQEVNVSFDYQGNIVE